MCPPIRIQQSQPNSPLTGFARLAILTQRISEQHGANQAAESGSVEASQDEFDPTKKFVRITGIQQNRLIEFDFSVGEPEIYIELVLPFQAFQDFCATNKVKYLTPEQAAAVDYDRLKWRSGQPGVEHSIGREK